MRAWPKKIGAREQLFLILETIALWYLISRLVSPLIQWKRFDASRQRLMKAQLEQIAALPDLSCDVYEIVNRGLQA